MATKTTPHMSQNNNNHNSRRTHRACDRCRVKKSKCNGQQPCNTCSANERTCVFSALRRRDIRKWHCRMQDTIDEAIQRLYRACRDSGSFPGVLPDEKEGFVTTESILHGMGFTNLDLGPSNGNSIFTEDMQQSLLHPHLINGPFSRDLPSRQHYLSEGHGPLSVSVGAPVAQPWAVTVGSSGSGPGAEMTFHHPLTPPTDPTEHADRALDRAMPNSDFVYTDAGRSQPHSNAESLPPTQSLPGAEAASMPAPQDRTRAIAWPYPSIQPDYTAGHDSRIQPYYMQDLSGWSSSHNLVSLPQE